MVVVGEVDFIRVHHTIRSSPVCVAAPAEHCVSILQRWVGFHTGGEGQRAQIISTFNRSLRLLYILTINTEGSAASAMLEEVSAEARVLATFGCYCN